MDDSSGVPSDKSLNYSSPFVDLFDRFFNRISDNYFCGRSFGVEEVNLPKATDVGVVIGRFQVPNFHVGHRSLLNLVRTRHKRVLVLLGSPAWKGGKADPLDYHTRALMFHQEYPDFLVAPITDQQTDETWSSLVDRTIQNVFPLSTVTLYGARDSFIEHYHGRFETKEIIQSVESSGTSVREETAGMPQEKESFRAGVIYGILNNPTSVVTAVDGAVLRIGPTYLDIVLIRKPDEKLLRFPGGKVDATDESFEYAVNREIREETGLEIDKPVYVTSSCSLPDWRANGAGITVHSSLFAARYIYGAPKGGDDAAEAGFYDLKSLTENMMEQCHRKLLTKLQQWYYTVGMEIFK
jgi:bifunctional NMN adenylyltransferase/nudix hydrolase